jgi:hypothetical protein
MRSHTMEALSPKRLIVGLVESYADCVRRALE